MPDDRVSARKPGGRDDACPPIVSPGAPGDSELVAPQHQPVGTVLKRDARRAPARPWGTPSGDASPPAAGPTSADHHDVPVTGAHPDSSTGSPAAGRPRRPIRREDVYTERMQGGGDERVDGGGRDELVFPCARCEETGRTCNACVQRRHRAWKLVDRDGRTIEEAAAVMHLPAATVRTLVAHERDRLELAGYRLNSIPTARARALLEEELERDPSLTRAEVAHRMNMSQADFDHQLGYAAAKKANGAKQQRVGIPLASSLTLALGRAPHELEGC